MKKISIIAALMICIFCGCSKDYLQTSPTSSTGAATIFETAENASLAINGIARLMTSQWISSQGFNGEGTIKMYYGNYPSANFFVNLSGWANTINGKYHASPSSTYDYYPWLYYYKLISNANSILVNIDNATGSESLKNFVKAQALTYRAYCYTMLVQLYCVRWSDSQNGTYNLDGTGLVLRLDDSDGDIPVSTSGEVYKQIYADLDEAIALFGQSSEKRSQNYEVNVDVAYATYARAAITKQDYAKALEMAKKARANYPLMDNAAYKAGFFTPTKEWIWGSFGGTTENLYYYSYHAYIAYNSTASAVRSYPKCIGRELFNKIPATDIRKSLFLDPTGYNYTTSTGKASSALDKYARQYAKADGRYGIASNATAFAYMQFKIACEVVPGVGWSNHFRSSEMVLIEAEANYFLNNTAAAQASLVELNKKSGRDAAYECTATGTDLLNEIKFYRSVELWGEGFEWFDYKRWGDTIDRKTYADGGNFIAALAVKIGPEAENHWTWIIPKKESDYNKGL